MFMEGPSDVSVNLSGSDDPFKRLCRLVFPRPIIDHQGRITDKVLQDINWVYDKVYGKDKKK